MASREQAAREQLERLDRVEEQLGRLLDEVRAASAEIAAEIGRLRVELPDLAAEPAPAPAPSPLSEPPVGGDAPEGDVEGARLVALELVMRGESDDEARRHLESAFPGVDAAAVLEKTRATIAS
ncbi:MAG: hypothetical protein ACKOQ0_05160 [Solirubrobacterales bacterium]